jgi:hypothetical protein
MRKSRRLRLTPLMFGIGASHWVAITCLPVLLFGCTAGSKSLPPYALSDAETTTVERATTTVERAIYPATKDLDKPGFRDLKAARSSNGDVYVCGWMDSNNKTYRAPEQAFIGTFSAGRFSPDRIGTNAQSNAEILVECQKLGITI